jgi:transposase
VIPPEANADFVYAMEQVLDLYQQPFDPEEPVVCFDEASKQLIAETRTPLPMQPGEPLRYDSEYQRQGTTNLFMFFDPLANWRHVEVTDRRTLVDFASCMKALVDDFYPQAKVIHVVLDNLNTHKLAALYAAFPAQEAHRIVQRLRFHFTPKHGSWLNMAEIELSILARQALADRIPDKETLIQEVQAWEHQRNNSGATVDWRFTTKDARIKLKRLYPSFKT